MVVFMRRALMGILPAVAIVVTPLSATAQGGPPSGPPIVGVAQASLRSITQQEQIIGRVEAIQRVDIVARVTGYLEDRLFTEGVEVKAGELLYRLERGTYEAAVESAHAAIDQAQAQLENATIVLGRSEKLLQGPAGTQSAVDQARANKLTAAGQLRAGQAQLRQAQINLDYTEIHSPIEGRIGRTTLTVGNLVGPSSGALATVVSQDPMYVVFPIAVRKAIGLRTKLSKEGFTDLKVRLRLPDGRTYAQAGTINFVDTNIASDTDTILLRASVPNPSLERGATGQLKRELVHGELVTVLLEDAEPAQLVSVPRSAVLSDQRGSYVYVLDDGNVAQRRDLQLGPSSSEWASIASGLREGERVVVDGLQRVRVGAPVRPEPASGNAASRETPAG